MNLPFARTRIQRVSWIGLGLAATIGAIALLNDYWPWQDFAQNWARIFDAEYGTLAGRAATWLTIASAAGLLAGGRLIEGFRTLGRWVSRGE